MLIASTASTAGPMEPRLERLEQRVQQLTRRLEALERASGHAVEPDATSSKVAGPTWTFEPPLDGSELRVLHQGLNPKTGVVDLLIRVEAPLKEPHAWGQTGAEVPIAITVDDGSTAPAAVAFKLVRGRSLEPGSSLHLRARIPVARAAKAGEIRVGPRKASVPQTTR
jgi:hypothetical protein